MTSMDVSIVLLTGLCLSFGCLQAGAAFPLVDYDDEEDDEDEEESQSMETESADKSDDLRTESQPVAGSLAKRRKV